VILLSVSQALGTPVPPALERRRKTAP